MLTRPKVSVTVVSAPTISQSPARRTSCSAQALSLPLDQAISAFGRMSSPRHSGAARRVGRALARFPGAADGAPQRLVRGFAGKPDAVVAAAPSAPGARLARPAPPPRRRRAPTAPRSSASRARAARLLDVGAVEAGEPVEREAIISASPLAASSRPKLPATSTMHSVEPETLAKIDAVRGPFDFSNTSSSVRSPADCPASSSAMWS